MTKSGVSTVDTSSLDDRPLKVLPIASDEVLVHPGSGSSAKNWPAEQFAETIRKLDRPVRLIVGEADTNVPPESTFRLADALIKSDKVFDLLAVPGMGHGDGGPYGRKKKKDFFVKHLLGVDPPDRNLDELGMIRR